MKALLRDRELLIPYLLALGLFLILFGSSLWYLYDGSTFHLYNFLTGLPNNARDVGRLGAMLFTDWADLLYIQLGGKSFFFSRQLYVFGQTFHLFFPLFFLSFIHRKFPEDTYWIVNAAWYYLVSLMLVRGMGLYFFISELYAFHTVSWLSILAYKSDIRKLHWATAIFSIFTYPAAFCLNLLFFMHQRKLSLYPFLALIALLFHLDYAERYPNLSPILQSTFSQLLHNWTVWFYLAMFFAIFFTQKKVGIILAITGVIAYIGLGLFSFGHMFQGRSVLLLMMIGLQTLFILPFPEKSINRAREHGLIFCLMALSLMAFQVLRLEGYQSALRNLLTTEERVLDFQEANEKLSSYPDFVRPYQVRIQTIDLMLMESKLVKAFVQPKFLFHQDLIHAWSKEEFLRLCGLKGITFTEEARKALPEIQSN